MHQWSRRRLIRTAALGSIGSKMLASPLPRPATARLLSEWYLVSGRSYRDPFNEVEVDVVFRGPGGAEQRVPAYWAGEQTWAVRYAPEQPGRYRYRSIATDTSNPGLHEITGELEVYPYEGNHPFYRHGALRVSADRTHLEHADGTPFFWLADTWWGGLVKRFRWPEDFQLLTADRVAKGFNVVQIAAGLLPIMHGFDPRAANEAGHVWEPGYARVNPAFFDLADLRIQHLVRRGLMPCIFGAWGYHIFEMGIEKMKKHWRYLIARWGAHPVVWCLAGEANMPWYLSQTKTEDRKRLSALWTEVGRYVRSIDPYRRLVTAHPQPPICSAKKTVDPAVLDFDMLQTMHPQSGSIPQTIRAVRESAASEPRMPVLNGEVAYEGVFGQNPDAHQRFIFWACLLNGAHVGHTYGAGGIWEVNTEEEKAGVSPDGTNWGETPWTEAYRLPGSGQLRHSKELLMRYPWWRLEARPQGVDPCWNGEMHAMPLAARIPGALHIAYFPLITPWRLPRFRELETGRSYHAYFFNPVNGRRHEIGRVTADAKGEWGVPVPPVVQDWVVALEPENRR